MVDTNVVAYLLLPGERLRMAEAALTKDATWLVPRLWRSEFRNVLALYLRRGQLTLEEALAVAGEAELLVDGNEYEVSSATVLRLAALSGCSAYDCEFVALAQDFGIKLVTEDGELIRKFPETALSLDAFVA
ncbi:MAG TPA: type II toxin-antitoxin system VapC family toxin [Candidatus Sulfomarinibacteraceae bacterium]|nr:type II toxin-antitoxin system VapC family toxin [Candidatus Sulfomarinibacteraceae bacterium]